MNEININKKRINDWSPTHISHFWQWYSRNPMTRGNYFSNAVGKAIFFLISRYKKIEGNFLDYGSGPGFLFDQIIHNDQINCYGIDNSLEAITISNTKFKGSLNWRGAFLPSDQALPIDFFNFITCLETVEHLHDEEIHSLLRYIYEHLQTGGIALFSTPNNEDLDFNMIYCPFCSSEFHPMQHLRSFTAIELTELLTRNNFNVLMCESYDLLDMQNSLIPINIPNISIKGLLSIGKHKLIRLLDQLSRKRFHDGIYHAYLLRKTNRVNLVAICEKS